MKTIFAALAALACATPAFAAEPVNPFASSRAVLSLKDLDLASVDGQQRLAIRMDQAARAVCGDRVASIHLALGEQSRACQAEVIADIRSKIEAPTTVAAWASPSPTLLAAR